MAAGSTRSYDDAVIEVVERTNNLKLAAELAPVARSRVYARLGSDQAFRRRVEEARQRYQEQSSKSRLEAVRRRLRRPEL